MTAPDDVRFVIHGPMWQFECKTCGHMGDCWDSESEAAGEMETHDCLEAWKRRIPTHILEHLIKEKHYL